MIRSGGLAIVLGDSDGSEAGERDRGTEGEKRECDQASTNGA